jgi:hypothetical protein
MKEAEAGADGRWLLQQFAPDVVAMLETAPDAADLGRLVELLRQGIKDVAQDRYRMLAREDQRNVASR